MNKHTDLPLRPYFPLSVTQVLTMRELLPHMVAWLRAREASQPSTLNKSERPADH